MVQGGCTDGPRIVGGDAKTRVNEIEPKSINKQMPWTNKNTTKGDHV
jgi:hypothetical protein